MAFRLTWNMCKAWPVSRAKVESHLNHHTLLASSSYFRRNLEATKNMLSAMQSPCYSYAVQTLQPSCACSSWDLKSLFLLQSDFIRTMARSMNLYCMSAPVSLDIMTASLLSTGLSVFSTNLDVPLLSSQSQFDHPSSFHAQIALYLYIIKSSLTELPR